MIVYRKAPGLRMHRQQVPEPPWWSATTLSPYGPKRSAPIAIDYLRLEATSIEKSEVTVIEDAADDLERLTKRQPLQNPVLIDATEFAELVFRRGEDLLKIAASRGLDLSLLVSARGALPEVLPEGVRVVIAAWPLEMERLEPLFAQASERGMKWGIAVPLLYPVTTSLPALSELVASATEFGASLWPP